MAKGTTWQKAKMEKLVRQRRIALHGGYEQGSENARRADKRDGGYYTFERPEPEVVGPFNAPSNPCITTGSPARARGLHRDIGVVGKGGRMFDRSGCTKHKMLHAGTKLVGSREALDQVWPLFVRA